MFGSGNINGHTDKIAFAAELVNSSKAKIDQLKMNRRKFIDQTVKTSTLLSVSSVFSSYHLQNGPGTGAKIDKILITNHMDYIPTETGGENQWRRQNRAGGRKWIFE